MKYIAYFFFYLIQFTWGILQNLAGLILAVKYRNHQKEFYHGAFVFYHKENWGGVSLGIFTVVNGDRNDAWKQNTRIHEYGHTVQSLILGPLYFPIIAIPSMIWCNAKRYINLRKEKGISYYAFYPERWANYLGEKVTKEKMENN